MGLLSSMFGGGDLPRAEAPSEAFHDPAAAIAHLVAAQREIADSWVTFEGETSAGTACTVQVADDSINFLLARVELHAVLERLGLTALASVTEKGGRKQADATLWTLPDSTPEELAAVLDALFESEFGLGPGYVLRGWIER